MALKYVVFQHLKTLFVSRDYYKNSEEIKSAKVKSDIMFIPGKIKKKQHVFDFLIGLSRHWNSHSEIFMVQIRSRSQDRRRSWKPG